MKLKSISALALATALCSWQCSSKDAAPIDYDQSSRDLMLDLKPQIVGEWNLRKVDVKYQSQHGRNRINLTKDSTFIDFATLTIFPTKIPRTSPVDTRQGEYDGVIRYNGKSYPVQFNMYANAMWLQEKKGPQTFLMFQYNFSTGSHVTEKEELFLEDIGLMYENFSLETTLGQPYMIWRGLNRGIERIEMVHK